ncbi:MAG: S41 family peptidase [Paludibacteraceae bacterium]|nr:S41 family peptidase [Paludibacteraceae bacterium]
MKKQLSVGLSLLLMAVSANAESVDYLRKLAYAYTVINSYYVDKTDVSKVTDDAIEGMLDKLDPHSSYLTKEKVDESREQLTGNFEGIGVSFNMVDDTLLVVQTITNGPSERVGIMAGDKIIAVNDSSIAGVKMKNSDIMKRLRGKKGTYVNVTVLRDGHLLPFTIERDKIPVYSVDTYYMIAPGVGYIKVNRFSATTYQEVSDAVRALKKQKMTRLILDLQDNGGGLMNAATSLADEFLDEDELIVYTQGEAQRTQRTVASGKGKLFNREKLVILVNEYSASASEILSGAIQDWDRGVIVGRRTFGKGLVQRPFTLPDSSEIRLTIARYYTPSGRCIQRSYAKGRKDYEEDLLNRYKHGEFVHADSISFPDSLKYTTRVAKRTVYGGGGIMPDIFVPADTARVDSIGRVVFNKGLVNKTVLQYLEHNRRKLRSDYSDFESFERKFEADSLILPELLERIAADSIPFTDENLERNHNVFSLNLKALLARYIWGMDAYFKIYNTDNVIVQKGLEIITDDRKYEAVFKKQNQ